MESIKESMQEMSSLFHTQMARFQLELGKSATKTPASSTSLAADFEAFKAFVVSVLNSLQKQIEFLAAESDRMEMRSRRKILLFHGVPESKDDDPAKCVIKVAVDRLKMPGVTVGDISRCHRLGRATSGKARPILVKFRILSVRDEIWLAKKNLKGSGVTISEFLTKMRHKLFMSAREWYGVSNCWTRDGNVFVVGSDGSRHRVASHAELEKIPCPVLATEEPKVVVERTQRKRAQAVKK